MNISKRARQGKDTVAMPAAPVHQPAHFDRLGGIEPQQIVDLDRNYEWFQKSYKVGHPELPREQNAHTIIELLTYSDLGFKQMANYAAKFNAFFFIAVQRQPDNTDVWTIMPAYNDRQIWEKHGINQIYSGYLRSSWAHIIIDPGEAARGSYQDSEQLGIMDADCSRGMLAFDVSVEDIRWDVYDRGRNTLVMEEGGWADWSGYSAYSGRGDFNYEGPAREVKQLGGTAISLTNLRKILE